MQHDVSGTWYNQHGSRVTLRVAEGALAGFFASSVGVQKRQEVKVVGFHAGNLVSFLADFAAQGSLTAWVGHVTGHGEESAMELQWQMTVALPGKENPSELWRGIWTGSDVFRRQPPAETAPRYMASHSFPDWP